MITKYKYITISSNERMALEYMLDRYKKDIGFPNGDDSFRFTVENLLKRSKHKEDEKD